MARISLLEPEAMDPVAATALEGRPMGNLFRVLAHSPKALAGFLMFGDGLQQAAELDIRLRELVILRVAALTRSAYELHHHKRIASACGLSEQQVAAATRDGPEDHLGVFELMVLGFTDAVVLDVKAPAPLYEAIAGRFSERQMIELLLTIGCYCMISRVLENAEVEIDPPELRAISTARVTAGD